MRVIGITGGVGSGKSQVLSHIQKTYQAVICQADHVAWELQNPGMVCYKQIIAHFGERIINDDKTINRKALGAIVFADKKELQKLNSIMHPAVKKAIIEKIEKEKQCGTNLFVLEAALLLEEQYDKICDEIWYIYTQEEVRKIRLKESRGYTDEKINAIMSSQSDETYFRRKCQKVIDNSYDFQYTCEQIQKVIDG